jgi:hypothetical protein
MVKWEYKFHYQPLLTKLSWTVKSAIMQYQEHVKESEKEINNIAKEGWELFSSHVTAFNTIVFIFRREIKDK